MASQEAGTVQVTSPPRKKSTWGTVSTILQGYGMSIVGGISMIVVGFALAHCNCFGVRGRISQDRRRRKRAKEKHEQNQQVKQDQLAELSIAIININEYTNSAQDRVMYQSNSACDKLDRNMNALHCESMRHMDLLGEKVLDNTNSSMDKLRAGLQDDLKKMVEAEVRIRIPESEEADRVERIVRAEFGRKRRKSDRIDVFKGSRILQLKVGLNGGILDEVRNLADALTAIEKGVTVQLDNFRVFIRTDRGVEMKTLDESHKVPVILHADYTAGKLTIEGLNLEKSTIKAATLDECLTLENIEHPQEKDGLEEYTWIVQLPCSNFEEVAVYAMKTIDVEEQEVLVCSSVVKIQDNNLRAVVRNGTPAVVWMIYFAKQLYHDGIKLIQSTNLGPILAWMGPCLVIILSQLLPSSTENTISASLERVRLVVWSLCCSFRSFLFKQYPRRLTRGHKRSLDGELKESNANATDNFDAGVERQTEINNMALAGLHSLTTTIANLDKTLSEIRCVLREEEDLDCNSNPDCDQLFNNMDTTRESIDPEGNSELVIDQDWQWQVYQTYKNKFGKVRLRKCGDDMKENVPTKLIPFDVVYGMKEDLWAERDYINIFSPLLIEIIVRLIPEYVYEVNNGCLQVYAAALFHIREKVREIRLKGVDDVSLPSNASSSEEDRGKQQLHLNHLLRFMDKELDDILKRYSLMENDHHVTWDMLWAFFPPGTQVVYRCSITDDEQLGIVIKATYEVSEQQGPFLSISIKTWDYDCKTWNAYVTSRRILKFDGECGFTSLGTFPLRFKNDSKLAEKEFLSRGESFCYLSMKVRNRFMNYKGVIYIMMSVNGCPSLHREAASGRVMVDLASFQKMNSSYNMGSAEPPCEVLRDNKVEPLDITTREDRMYAPAMVYGFSFRLKKWGTFRVCGFSEIVFNDSAFDALVMPQQKKELVYKLVREYIPKVQDLTTEAGSEQVEQVEEVDPIDSKGEGCIILCYGGPGTGKTLTAESISETLHAPLWSLSVSELGTTPQALESYLVRILDVAATWSAILLLDEADVYLEKRSSIDLTRNAMTGIFLRNLEYYRGVLFLTTNRVVTFDEAFRSRISMILYYETKPADRRKIWESILNRVNMKDIPESRLAEWSGKEINGREIRNVVHRAMILAKSNQQRLSGDDIEQSLNDVVDSLEVLEHNCSSGNV